MSESRDKANRRELRKAFGDTAYSVIDNQGKLIEMMAATINGMSREFLIDRRRLDEIVDKLGTFKALK